MSRREKPRRQAGLVGYLYESGRVVCVDCDVYPPDTKDVRKGDPQTDRCCHYCGTPLNEVIPIGE